MQAGHYRVSGGGVRDSSNPYDMVEEELVSGALKDSLVAARDRGKTHRFPAPALRKSCLDRLHSMCNELATCVNGRHVFQAI